MMLIYSAAVATTFVRDIQDFETCMRFELCAPYFELLPFLAEIAFWFIILYSSVTLNPGAILKSGRYRWIGLLAIALGIWHLATELIILSNLLKTPLDLGIFPHTVILCLLIPWLIWLCLELWQMPRPTVSTVLMVSVSVILTTIRFLNDNMMNTVLCRLRGIACQEIFSLISFLIEIAYWFIPLYGLLKLVSKMETRNLSIATS